MLKQHIMEVASRYRGKAYAWDVVNEAVSDNPQGTKYLKTNIWYPTGKFINIKEFISAIILLLINYSA